MAEYIEREALLKKAEDFEESARKLYRETPCTDPCYSERAAKLSNAWEFKYMVIHAPAADVAPVVHGHWILDSIDEYAAHYHCGVCGAEIDLCNEIYAEPTPEYCQYCGSKMDKEEK